MGNRNGPLRSKLVRGSDAIRKSNIIPECANNVHLDDILDLLEPTPVDIMSSLLRKLSPGQFQSRTAAWKKHPRYGPHDKIPTAKEFGNILRRDDFRCQKCGSQLDLQIHHINSICTDHRLENLQALCRICNIAEHSKSRKSPNPALIIWTEFTSFYKEYGHCPDTKELSKIVREKYPSRNKKNGGLTGYRHVYNHLFFLFSRKKTKSFYDKKACIDSVGEISEILKVSNEDVIVSLIFVN